MRDWWNTETAKKFTEKAQCVVEQFGNFTAEQVGLNLNGINTQGENIADMGGLLPAYEGYGKIDFASKSSLILVSRKDLFHYEFYFQVIYILTLFRKLGER